MTNLLSPLSVLNKSIVYVGRHDALQTLNCRLIHRSDNLIILNIWHCQLCLSGKFQYIALNSREYVFRRSYICKDNQVEIERLLLYTWYAHVSINSLKHKHLLKITEICCQFNEKTDIQSPYVEKMALGRPIYLYICQWLIMI